MFNQGDNPEAVQQKGRVKGKKHLKRKRSVIQDHPESHLSQWVKISEVGASLRTE